MNEEGIKSEYDVPAKKKLNRWPIVLGVMAAVLVVAFGGFMYWHEQPSFCGAFCHTPMDPYLATYNYGPGEPAVDKWGKEVSDSNAMMAVTHKAQGANCLDCHVPTIKEQLYEGMKWIAGNYANPLIERTLSDLVKARGIPNDEFCLNSGCHHVDADGAPLETREDLVISSAYLKRPVHTPQHAVFKCSACHKAHRASVIYCSKCHDDAEFPAGWRPYGTIEQTTSTPRCADVPDLCN